MKINWNRIYFGINDIMLVIMLMGLIMIIPYVHKSHTTSLTGLILSLLVFVFSYFSIDDQNKYIFETYNKHR